MDQRYGVEGRGRAYYGPDLRIGYYNVDPRRGYVPLNGPVRRYSGTYETAYYGEYRSEYYGPNPQAPVVHGLPSLPIHDGRAEEAVKWYTVAYGAVNTTKISGVRDRANYNEPTFTKYTMRLGPENDGRAFHFEVESRAKNRPIGNMRYSASNVDMCIFVENPDAFIARALAGGAHEMGVYYSYTGLEDPFGYTWRISKANLMPKDLIY